MTAVKTRISVQPWMVSLASSEPFGADEDDHQIDQQAKRGEAGER
jgi:hypothetical protein